jgi:hypothetical protein
MRRERNTNLRIESDNMTDIAPSATGIIQQPTQEDLRPSEREVRLLQDIFNWAERSKDAHWVWGQPIGIQL